MYDDLNTIQLNIFEYIKKYILEIGYPPSVREIAEGVGLKSTSTVHSNMNKLAKLGYIRKNPSKPRAIEVINNNITLQEEFKNIPLVGTVAAGNPILAEENISDVYNLPQDKFYNVDYILRVSGDSMIDAGIFNGDYVMVRKQDTALNGEIVVALIDDSATIKRFYKEKSFIKLVPENKMMEPIIVDSIKIMGIVKSVFRNI